MKTIRNICLIMVSLLCSSCVVAILDCEYTYKESPPWQKKEKKCYYRFSEDDLISFHYSVSDSVSIVCFPLVAHLPFMAGPAPVPLFPNLIPTHKNKDKFWHISVMIDSSLPWNIKLSDVTFSSTDSVMLDDVYLRNAKKIWKIDAGSLDSTYLSSNIQGQDLKIKFYFSKNSKHIKEMIMVFNGLVVDGKNIDVPPLILKSRRRLYYLPLTILGTTYR